MALDRQSIEKRDFPIGRRGYEPEAVDAHLARIADEVEKLRRSARGGDGSAASIAQAASEQVRAIVEAAESSAADIERAAQEEAARIRDEAEADARRTRDEAVAQSQEHVGRVRQATKLMLERVEAMEAELNALVESLRTGANRLTADLSLLESGMGDLYEAAGRERPAVSAAPAAPAVEPEPVAEPEREPEPGREPEPEADSAADEVERIVAELEGDEPAGAEEPVVRPVEDPAEQPTSAGGDIEGARLVALNMALNGSPREETDRYIAENFDVPDRKALLDEVYATIEG